MMSHINWNQIIGCILLGLLVGMMTSFFSRLLVVPDELDTFVYPLEVSESLSQVVATEPVILGPEPITSLLIEASVERGQRLSRACIACHSFDASQAIKVGPPLWNIVSASIAGHEGYNYSSALTNKEGIWSYESLNEFLYNPRLFAPGTKMTYVGLSKTQDRADMIRWLRELSDNPVDIPLPSEEIVPSSE